MLSLPQECGGYFGGREKAFTRGLKFLEGEVFEGGGGSAKVFFRGRFKELGGETVSVGVGESTKVFLRGLSFKVL